MFSFKYSPRPLTKAAEFKDQIPSDIAGSRLKTLQDLHTKIIDEISLKQKGKTFSVLFEELKNGGMIAGRSDNNFMVQAKGSEEYLGKIVNVVINNPKRMVLYGEIIEQRV